VLVDDPSDGAGFGRAVSELLADKARAREMGAHARARVLDRFLSPRQLTETMDVVCELA
jgi:glycosyltransferase involved in cell wall biosynthesis